jgi:outer membrane protein OmpA-like peptidoglycan-associated protein
MAIEHELTYGDQDIYVSFRNDDNSWTRPENIGPVVNTDGVEYSPFLAPDDITLYFASNGHKGFGAGDAFMTKRLDDSWTNWSEPVNMGEEINTHDWDGYFTIAAKGDYAYFTSAGSRMNEKIYKSEDEDIYRIALREEVKPEPMIVLKGNVYNNKTREPMNAQILLKNAKDHADQSTVHVTADNNYYSFVIPVGMKHNMNARSEGFLPEAFDFDHTKVTEYTEIHQDIFLNPIERGEILKLNNLFFVQSQAELLPESLPELERLYGLLVEFPEMEIELMGHTDSQGVAAANLRLSRERAQAVKDFLVDRGIDKGRIEAVGYGEKKPVVSNKDPELRKQNRRVEVKILKKQ